MARERGEPTTRPEPGAAFASTRVQRERRRPPFALIALLVAVGALGAVGISGRGPDPGAGPAPRATASEVAAAERSAAKQSAIATVPGDSLASVAPQMAAGPEMTSEPGALTLVAQRLPDSVFVHGDVFVDRVTWVYVSLHDAAGRVAGWASVSAPGGVGRRAGDGPSMRFDLELAAPLANFPDELTLAATAYDDTGKQVAAGFIAGLRPRYVVLAADTGWPPSRSLGDALVPVRLSVPDAASTVVRSGSVGVAGELRVKADSVRIALQTPDRQVLAETTVDTADPDGGIRPVRMPSFDVQLTLPDPRPIDARLVVVITAYDSRGTPLGLVRRSVTVAPLGS